MKSPRPFVLATALLWLNPVAASPIANSAQGPAPVLASSVAIEIPPALKTEFVYEAVVEIGSPVVLGKTASGHRQYIPITGGTFQGTKLRGTILPGGADWQTTRPDGVTEVSALYSMKCDDGTVIIVNNCGVITMDGGFYARTAPQFQVADGPHAWLTRSQFVGSVAGGPRPGTVTIRVFRLL